MIDCGSSIKSEGTTKDTKRTKEWTIRRVGQRSATHHEAVQNGWLRCADPPYDYDFDLGRARLLPSLRGRLGRSLALPSSRSGGVMSGALKSVDGARGANRKGGLDA
jgi:hypothetical protein